jgi:hypothetical protein
MRRAENCYGEPAEVQSIAVPDDTDTVFRQAGAPREVRRGARSHQGCAPQEGHTGRIKRVVIMRMGDKDGIECREIGTPQACLDSRIIRRDPAEKHAACRWAGEESIDEDSGLAVVEGN